MSVPRGQTAAKRIAKCRSAGTDIPFRTCVCKNLCRASYCPNVKNRRMLRDVFHTRSYFLLFFLFSLPKKYSFHCFVIHFCFHRTREFSRRVLEACSHQQLTWTSVSWRFLLLYLSLSARLASLKFTNCGRTNCR